MSGPRRFVRSAATWCTSFGFLAAGAGVAGLAGGMGGCQPGTKPNPEATESQPVAPSYRTLVQEHNERVARLAALHANGTITLRWTDDRGAHTEQADIELWLAADGTRMAAHIQKGAIGEEFVRLGADAGQSWLLDLRKDEKVLYVAPSDRPLGADESLPIAVSPWALLDLMGLTALPPSDGGPDEKVTSDDEHDAWVVTSQGRSGPMRIYFNRKSLLPTRVELLTTKEDVRQSSQMPAGDYQSVARDGVSTAEFGKMPMRIRLFDSTSAEDSVSISLDEVTGRASDPRMTDKVFDLERLKRQFSPRVEGVEGR